MSTSHCIADRFEIRDPEKELLGHGGMGDVYRATDALTEETVAIKALTPDVLARDPGPVERSLREGEALRRLNHPDRVRMVTACEQDSRHYLVMEYVGGGSLEGLLQSQGRLPAARAIEMGLDLGDALTRVHRLGIIHRDLKPAEEGKSTLHARLSEEAFIAAMAEDESLAPQQGIALALEVPAANEDLQR